MKLASLKSSCKNVVLQKDNISSVVNFDNVDPSFWLNEPLFCKYQVDWLLDKAPVSVTEKSRQIGFSWLVSFRAVFKAAKGERDTVINSYNLMASKEVIKDCVRWAKLFNIIFQIVIEKDIVGECNIFEVKFLNGYSVYAISGDPVNFRGKSGADIVIDEAAYRQIGIGEILAAAMATLIHGGTIRIGSTHAGEDSDFNEFVKQIKEGKYPYSLHKTTFRDAVNQGLYKRICQKQGKLYSEENEKEWVDFIYSQYGDRAQEELDVIPSDFSEEGKLFDKFYRVSSLGDDTWNHIYIRYHDLASTEDEKDEKETAYYSASMKLVYNIESKIYTIIDWQAEKLSPLDGDKMITDLAVSDGQQCIQLIEEEPGSSGQKYVAIMQRQLAELGCYQVYGYNPKVKKLKRLIPVANAVKRGQVVMIDRPDMNDLERLLKRISKVPKPLISDLGDNLSGIYDYMENEYNAMLGS